MSRVGKHPIVIPAGIKVTFNNGLLVGSGKNGTFEFAVHSAVRTELADDKLTFKPADDGKLARSMWGTSRAIVAKAVSGLSKDFVKKVSLVGVGYKDSVSGGNLVMQLGYSHDIVLKIPPDLKITCENPTVISVAGANSQRVGEIVREIQRYRKPEPYKGKGVIIEKQFVRRKEGKKK